MKKLTPKGNGFTYEQMIAAGWTDALLISEGYLEIGPPPADPYLAPATAKKVAREKLAVPTLLSPDPRTPVTLPSDPLETARKFLEAEHTDGDCPTLLWWRDEFYRFTPTGAWEVVDLTSVHNQIWHYLERERAAGLQPTDRNTNEVLKALKGLLALPKRVDAPCWHQDRSPVTEPIIVCRNGILNPDQIGAASALQSHTPKLFTLAAVPVDYDPQAPEPVQWLEFLDGLWGDDPDSITALQEIMGLLLMDDMSFQKIFLLVGPGRSGKGTILKVIKALLGNETVASPTLNSLGSEFGMQPLIGKLAALIGDARSGKGDKQIVGTERLLTISGGDGVDINRKNLSFWNGRLAVRFVLASNMIPAFADAAGVIATRFVVLRLRVSFLGREDPGLADRLCTELPGILNWALAGRWQLYKRGRFIQPESAIEDIEQIRDLASPITAFVRERCTLGSEASVDKAELYKAWREYCSGVNQHPGTRDTFASDLYAAFPTVRSVRPREDSQDRSAPRPRIYAGIALTAPPAELSRAGSITTGLPSPTPLATTAAPLCVHGWKMPALPCPQCMTQR